MLPTSHRLTQRTDFQRVYRSGRQFSQESVILKVAPGQKGQVRIGFSIEKKYFPKAAERNTIKRWLRGFFGNHLEQITLGQDIVVICRRSGSTGKKISKNNLISELEILAQKSRILAN